MHYGSAPARIGRTTNVHTTSKPKPGIVEQRMRKPDRAKTAKHSQPNSPPGTRKRPKPKTRPLAHTRNSY